MPSSPPLGVNVFTAPEKAVVGERPRPFGPPLAWDPTTSTLIFGERDAVLVDALATVAEASALADWVALHHRNLTTIYITHGHFDHYFGLAILLARFPQARAIATPRSVRVGARTSRRLACLRSAMLAGSTAGGASPPPSPTKRTPSPWRDQNCASSSRAAPTRLVPPRRTCPPSTSSSAVTSSTTSATCSSATPPRRAGSSGPPPWTGWQP